MTVETIGVVGAGKMGTGIAISAALAGYRVILQDIIPANLENAMDTIKEYQARINSKGRVNAKESAAASARISRTSTYEGYDTADFIIEAVVENLKIKNAVFAELDKLCKKNAVFCSSTSTFLITSIAAATERPEKVAGMHFFLPPSKLVEITRGYYTGESTVAAVKQVCEKMGKVSIDVRKDSPGFIANRVYTPLFLEAFKTYEEGLATIEEIDQAMTATYLPIGPFALADIIGLDVILSGLEYYEKEIGDQWKAPRSLKELVRAGRLGKKTGGGWYDYKEK